MTDISREAVERLVCSLERERMFQTAKTLRALRDALDKAEAERDSYRAVLVGMEFQDIEGIGKNGVEKSTALGELVKERILSRKPFFMPPPCAHPNKQASTCGFYSCPDCGARLEDE